MKVFDMHHDIAPRQALAQVAITTATNTDCTQVDTAGFESLQFLFLFGVIAAGGVATIELHHSDTDGFTPSAETLVSTEETLGNTTIADTNDNLVGRIGYIGKSRYVVARIVSTTVNSIAVAAISVLGTPHHAPVADGPLAAQ